MSNDHLDLFTTDLARVDRTTLRAARAAIQIIPELQHLFARADEEQWDESKLASELASALVEYVIDTEGCGEIAQILAKEHLIRDKSKILILSSETGLPLAQLPPEAVYLPAPVAREGTTNLAQPLPRLRPEFESAIVQSVFTRGQELVTLERLAERSPLQLQGGDPKLLIVTARGRKQLLERLRREAPTLLDVVPDAPGMVNDFLGLCGRSDLAGFGPEFSVSLEASATVSLIDMLAKNFQHDPYIAARESLRNQLVRNLALQCVIAAHKMGSTVVSIKDMLPPGFLAGSPGVAIALRPRHVLPLEGETALFRRGPHLNPISFDCQGRDYQRRWEVRITVDLEIRMPLSGISVYEFSDLLEPEPLVEVM